MGVREDTAFPTYCYLPQSSALVVFNQKRCRRFLSLGGNYGLFVNYLDHPSFSSGTESSVSYSTSRHPLPPAGSDWVSGSTFVISPVFWGGCPIAGTTVWSDMNWLNVRCSRVECEGCSLSLVQVKFFLCK